MKTRRCCCAATGAEEKENKLSVGQGDEELPRLRFRPCAGQVEHGWGWGYLRSVSPCPPVLDPGEEWPQLLLRAWMDLCFFTLKLSIVIQAFEDVSCTAC
jgi:hypothetical protein